MTIEIRLLQPTDGALLANVAPDVFDEGVRPNNVAEFLADSRHHIAVAIDAGQVVGFASGVHYIHPDKPAELWVNEVGVAPTHQRRGLATQIIRALFDAGAALGCKQAWVLTERSNIPAMRLYESIGGSEPDDETVLYEFELLRPDAERAAEDSPHPQVRLMRPDEIPAVTEMMRALWPDATDYDFTEETVFVWERPIGGLGGFASLSIRPWADGCETMPVPYIEGWWVAPDLRRMGVGGALFAAVERWCKARGYRELGSDVEIENATSLAAHKALGFEPTLRLQYFRKRLS